MQMPGEDSKQFVKLSNQLRLNKEDTNPRAKSLYLSSICYLYKIIHWKSTKQCEIEII